MAVRRDRRQPRPRTARDDGCHRRADLARRHALRRQLEPLPRAQGAGAGGGAARSGRCRAARGRGRPDARRQRPSARRARTAPARRKRAKGDMPRIVANSRQSGSREDGRRECPPRRAAPRAGGRGGRRPRASASRCCSRCPVAAALDRPAGRQDGAARSTRRAPATERSARSSRGLVLRHRRPGACGDHRPERLGQDDPAGARSPASSRRGSGSVRVDDRLRDARPAGEPARSVAVDPRQFPAAQSRTPTRMPAAPPSPASCSGPTRPCRSCRP